MTRFIGTIFLIALVLAPGAARAQPDPAAKPSSGRAESVEDSLGRRTPRGTVRGFLSAARKGDDEIAAQYLNTRLQGDQAKELAHQLFIVLDTRLPARLAQLSTEPEGSRAEPLQAESGARRHCADRQRGDVDVTLERVKLGTAGGGLAVLAPDARGGSRDLPGNQPRRSGHARSRIPHADPSGRRPIVRLADGPAAVSRCCTC